MKKLRAIIHNRVEEKNILKMLDKIDGVVWWGWVPENPSDYVVSIREDRGFSYSLHFDDGKLSHDNLDSIDGGILLKSYDFVQEVRKEMEPKNPGPICTKIGDSFKSIMGLVVGLDDIGVDFEYSIPMTAEKVFDYSKYGNIYMYFNTGGFDGIVCDEKANDIDEVSHGEFIKHVKKVLEWRNGRENG